MKRLLCKTCKKVITKRKNKKFCCRKCYVDFKKLLKPVDNEYRQVYVLDTKDRSFIGWISEPTNNSFFLIMPHYKKEFRNNEIQIIELLGGKLK